MQGQARQIYEFGPFRLDPHRQILARNGDVVPLTPKTFETLLVLLRAQPKPVSKEELMKAVWPDTFVEDSNLSRNIFMLRKALGETSDEHRYVVTLPGRGYKFAETVRTIDSADSSPKNRPAVSMEVPAAPPAPTSAPWMFRPWMLVVVSLLLLSGALLGNVAGSRDWLRATISSSPLIGGQQLRSVVVLPLENLSADDSQEYFAEGLTDELTTRLAALPGIRVISRTSAVQYKDRHKTATQIGRELGVDAILEGTVERVGDRVRLRMQLIRAATDQHVWAESYDYSFNDILALESDFARSVALQIRLHLGAPPTTLSRTRTVNPPAFEDYLKGRYFWNRRDDGGLDKAVQYFQRAIDEDPKFAPAYGEMAQSYVLLEEPERARSAAETALNLDPTLAEAHTALALVNERYWNFPEAEREYKLAIQLNPNYATAHHWYGEGYLTLMGRFEEAEHEMKLAQSLDPVSRIIATDYGAVLYFEGHYDEAYGELSKVLEMEPEFSQALMFRGAVLLRQKKYEPAIADLQRAAHIDNRPWRLGVLGWGFGVAGRPSDALAVLHQLEAISEHRKVPPWSFAIVYIGLGNRDNGIAWLEKAYAEHSGDIAALKIDPVYDPLRSDPRFLDLERRAGLTQ